MPDVFDQVSTGQTYDTQLSPDDETDFQQWKAKYAPRDSGQDYDLRGAFLAGLTPDPATGHWPDTYKKPNHPTFSDQSIYASQAPGKAGHWQGEQYVPAAKADIFDHVASSGSGDIFDQVASPTPASDKAASEAIDPFGLPPTGPFSKKSLMEVLRGANLAAIPLDVLKSVTPALEGIHAIHQAIRFAQGEPIEQVAPETQELKAVEKTPPFSQERIAFGANQFMNLAFLKEGAQGLAKQAKGGEVDANGARTSTDSGSEATTPQVEQGAEGTVRVRDTSQNGVEAGTGEVAGTESYARYQSPEEIQPIEGDEAPDGQTEEGASAQTVPTEGPGQNGEQVLGGAGESPPPASTPKKPAGIAQRIYDERGLNVQPGQGTSPENLIARGSTITADQAEARIRQTKAVGIDDILALRGRAFELQKETNAAKDALDARPRDPAAKAAYDAALANEQNYAQNVVKPAQNIWAGAGHAQQGAVDVDTGTFAGIQRAVTTLHKRALTPEEAHVGRAAAENVQRATRAEAKALQNAATLVAKKVRPKGKARRSLEQLREDLANKTRELTPC